MTGRARPPYLPAALSVVLGLASPATAIIVIIEPHEVRDAEARFRRQAARLRNLQEHIDSTASRLTQQAAALDEQSVKLKQAAARCRERVARHELDICHVSRKGAQLSPADSDVLATHLTNQAGLCRSFQPQIDQDRRALATQLSVIQRGQKELQEWNDTNNEAQLEAVRHAAVFALGRFASVLGQQANAARSLKGWVTRYEKQLASEGLPVEALLPKLQDTIRRYNAAYTTAAGAKSLETTLEAEKLFQGFKDEISAIALQKGETDSTVREMLADSRIQKYISRDRPDVDFKLFLAEGSTESVLSAVLGQAKAAPMVNFASFIVDSTYDATKFKLSWDRIMQQYDLSGSSERAVVSLERYLSSRNDTTWGTCFSPS
jgi:hypothetical protein